MTNYKKFFGTPELTAETLEKIIYGQLNICELMCNFSRCNKDILLRMYADNEIDYLEYQRALKNLN